jgi:hypothetical protein
MSNTFLVVEAGKPVPWTKPEDLCYDPDGPLPELDCIFTDGFRAAMADGSVRSISKQASEATLRAAITRNGNGPLGSQSRKGTWKHPGGPTDAQAGE